MGFDSSRGFQIYALVARMVRQSSAKRFLCRFDSCRGLQNSVNTAMDRYDEDWQIWHKIDLEDRWVYDKLILSSMAGHVCGPAGTPVPTPGMYIVRPITNVMGMGIQAKLHELEWDTEHLMPGTFWCEYFEGRHLSVDYIHGEQTLCVEGIKDDGEMQKFRKWKKVLDNVPLPAILEPLKKKYPFINCEFIGGKLIEAHLRHNPDFEEDVEELIVVWEGESTIPPEGMEFVEKRDYNRSGFFRWIRDKKSFIDAGN